MKDIQKYMLYGTIQYAAVTNFLKTDFIGLSISGREIFKTCLVNQIEVTITYMYCMYIKCI